jgi:hypothetical protein
VRTLEQSLGYLGSRVLYPARSIEEENFELSPASCEKLADQALHVEEAKRQTIAQRLGYAIGDAVYESYLAGSLSKTALRNLFLCHLNEPGAARDISLALADEVRIKRRKARTASAGM